MSTFPLVFLEKQSNVHLLGTNIMDLVCETYSMTQTVPKASPYGYRVFLKIMQQMWDRESSGRCSQVVPTG